VNLISYVNVCFSDTEGVATDDNTEVSLASIIRGGLEYANTDPSDMSLPLFDMMDNDRVFAQYSGTAVTDVDRMRFSSLADVNKISAEVGSNRSIDNNLPVAIEAGDRGGSVRIESRSQGSRHQRTLLRGTFLGRGKLETDQQSDLSVCHDTVEALNAKDEVTAVSSDLSQTSEVMLDVGIAYKHAESNSRPVEFSDVENLSRSSHSAVNTTSTISEHSSDCGQDSDVIDGDKSAVGCKSPVPMNDSDVMQVEIRNEQQVFTSASSSVTAGTITHMVDSSINIAESVDDAQCFSPSETENVDIQLMSKDNASVEPGNDSAAPAVCSTKEAFSVENCNILPTDNVEQDEVHLELSPIAHTVTDSAVSGSTSRTSPLVVQVECDNDEGAVVTGMSEPLNDASIVPDATNADESAAESDQALMQNSEEMSAETSERCAIETDVTNKEDVNDDSDSSVSCEVEVTNISSSSSTKEQTVDEEQSSDMIEVEYGKTVDNPENVAVTDEQQKSVSVSSGALNCPITGVNTDQSEGLLARKKACQEHLASELRKVAVLGTVSYITRDKQVNVLPLTEETQISNINTTNKLAGISSNSGNSCEAAVVLSDDKVPLEPTTSASNVSDASSTVTNHVTDAVEPDSHKEADSGSCVIILKSSASLTEPSSVSIPCISSPALLNILKCAASTAASVVTSSAGSTYQVPQYVMSSMKEREIQSGSYRPAAALAMNVGKNLVTEFVFRDIALHEEKWKNAADAEKVPINI